MSNNNFGILTLVADLVRDVALKDRLGTDPDSVFSDYGITREEIGLLHSRELEKISEHLAGEAMRALETLKEPARVMAPWCPGEPYIIRIQPSEAAVDRKVKVVVHGLFFEECVDLVFRNPSNNVTTMNGQLVVDEYGRSTFTGTVCFQETGVYDAALLDKNGLDKAVLSQAMVVH